MEYTLFNEDQRSRILQEKLRTYEIRHFEAELNVEVGMATGASPEELAVFQKAVRDFVTCIAVVKAQLAKYPAPAPKPGGPPRTTG